MEVGWLKDRLYPSRAAGTLVGDHHQLTERQRRAVMRCACGVRAAQLRRDRQQTLSALRGATLFVDGFNVLVTVEAAQARAALLLGQDGCLRDMASQNGRLGPTELTAQALLHIGACLAPYEPEEVRWFFDAPVPFSGRVRTQVDAVAKDQGWPWRAETVPNPDPVLKDVPGLVASADGAIIEVSRWVNLARHVVETRFPESWIVDLSPALPWPSAGPRTEWPPDRL